MKIVTLFFILILSLNASWKMFSGKENTFLYNEKTGETYRYYQIIDNNTLQKEGMVRVNFTSYAKYPVRNQLVSPRGYTPKEMKAMEEKLIDSAIKE